MPLLSDADVWRPCPRTDAGLLINCDGIVGVRQVGWASQVAIAVRRRRHSGVGRSGARS